MPKPYDAALKQLIDAFAGDWLAWLRPRLGVPADAAFDALDADLGTVSPQADKLSRFRDPPLGLAHLELQSGADLSLPGRLLVYNVLAEYRHGGPVHSVVLLLRRQAATSDLTGSYQRRFADGTTYLEFRYTVVRLWEASSEELLTGPLGTVPLAGLTDDAAANLPAVMARSIDRMRREATHEDASTLINDLCAARAATRPGHD